MMAMCSLKALFIVTAIMGTTALSPSVIKPKHHQAKVAAAAKAASASIEPVPEACMCKNWKETYQNSGLSCGAGQEFFFKLGKTKPDAAKLDEAKKLIGQTICANFYEVLNFNKCVNMNVGKDQGQWCYVDAACAHLNAGGKVPDSQLSWKKCEPGQDAMLRDLSPEELNKTAHESDLELGLLHKMSYPLSKAWEGKRFPEVQAFWGVGDVSVDTYPTWLKEDMKKITDTGKPFSFDNSLDERTPHTIVVGKKAYRVVDNAQKDEAHPGTWETLECIASC